MKQKFKKNSISLGSINRAQKLSKFFVPFQKERERDVDSIE
jgi:hypothetical protein